MKRDRGLTQSQRVGVGSYGGMGAQRAAHADAQQSYARHTGLVTQPGQCDGDFGGTVRPALGSLVLAVASQVNCQDAKPPTEQRTDQWPLERGFVVSRTVYQTDGSVGRDRRGDEQARYAMLPIGDVDCPAASFGPVARA